MTKDQNAPVLVVDDATSQTQSIQPATTGAATLMSDAADFKQAQQGTEARENNIDEVHRRMRETGEAMKRDLKFLLDALGCNNEVPSNSTRVPPQ